MKFKNPFKVRPVKAYWWREVPNFGDAIAPLLLQRFAEIKTVEWDTISHASIASVGSIIEHIPPLWDGYILGSGRLYEDSRIHLHTNTATILAVRGPLTARGLKGDFALGDPGLLANELVDTPEKEYDLGIIPHWQDTELAERFINLIPRTSTYKVINHADDPLEVIRQIGSCRRVVTSSLHGMIIADSFSIPRRVEVCEKMNKDGNGFKFRDYSASINCPFKPGVMQTPSRFHIEDRQYEIWDAFKALRDLLGKS
jgi:hypothetical protein